MSASLTSALVSVIVPAWQPEPHAEAALRSVHDQDHEAIEVIVVDDASQPRAGSSIRSYLERDVVRARFRRVTFVGEDSRSGISRAINRGLRESEGDYVNILQADDAFAGQRFSRLLCACAESGAELAFSRVEPRGNTPASGSSPAGEAAYVHSVQDDIEFFPTVGYALLRSQCAVSTGNLFFSRRLAEQVGGFGDHEHLYGWDFALRCLLVTEPVFVPEPLCQHRLRPHETFLQRHALEAREAEAVLKHYLFMSRNRPVANPLAPSPAWGPFFDSFVELSKYGKYLTKP